MENDRLDWLNALFAHPESPDAAKYDATKPRVVVLVSSADSKSCCAANFERTVFRSQKVVADAKKHFVPVRIDRSTYDGRALYAKFKLDSKKPAMLLLDEEGRFVAKTQLCCNPKEWHKSMTGTLGLVRAKAKYRPIATKKVARVREMIKEGQYASALRSIDKLSGKEKILTGDVRSAISKASKRVKNVAVKRIKAARRDEKSGRLDRALERFRSIEKDFSGYSKARDYARKAVRRIRAAQAESA